MSDLLTHWAVFDDCRRLAGADETICPALANAIDDQRETARLGALSRKGAIFVPEILKTLRKEADALPDDPRLQQKLAYALGAVTHYGADEVLKPLMSFRASADWHAAHLDMKAGRPATSIREISAYYDTHVFRKVYLEGQAEPFDSTFLHPADSESVRALEAFVRSLFQRALLSCHTLAPDAGNIDAWLDRLLDTVQPLYVDIETYVRVFAEPEPEKLRQFGVTTVFYREDDPAVMLARGIQNNRAVTQEQINAGLDPQANHGGYGHAIALSMQRLREASAWWNDASHPLPDLHQTHRHRVQPTDSDTPG
jgi:hypothetical protein